MADDHRRNQGTINHSQRTALLRVEDGQEQPDKLSVPRGQDPEYAGVLQNADGRKERYRPDLTKSQFLANMYQYFKNAVSNSKPAKDYLQQRSLDHKKIEVGYNAGQFHHGARKDENVINQCLEYGLLIDRGIVGRTGEKAYGVFGKWSICFALKDRNSEVTGLYFRSTLNDKESRHFYLKNRKGLYPNYPDTNTKKLILTESIIDGASLLQIEDITK